MMLRKRSGNIEWLEFELFQEVPGLVHGVFLKHGGVSVGEFSSLNVCHVPGEDPDAVSKNIELVRGVLGIDSLVRTKQCHGPLVQVVKNGIEEVSSCDGMLTQEQGVGLMVKHADCQAAIMVDPVKRVLATIHAGWRGNVQNIYKNAVEKFQEVAGSRPEDLLVGISPSLGPEASQFIHYRTEFPEAFWKFQFKPDYFNLWEIARWQLLECGLLSHHIEIASICTYANSADFFSYRREKISGRHATCAAFVSS